MWNFCLCVHKLTYFWNGMEWNEMCVRDWSHCCISQILFLCTFYLSLYNFKKICSTFEVLTELSMSVSVFLGVTLCQRLSMSQHFLQICHHHYWGLLVHGEQMCQKTHILTKKCNFEYGFAFLDQTVQKHNAVSTACFNDICFK